MLMYTEIYYLVHKGIVPYSPFNVVDAEGQRALSLRRFHTNVTFHEAIHSNVGSNI